MTGKKEIDIGKTIVYWLESAIYDMDTGSSLMRSRRYPYALFFGHLALEKLLKALVVKHTGDHAPFSHSLIILAGRTGLDLPEAILDQLAEFMEFHTEARYPDVKMEFYQKCTPEFARDKFRAIKKVYVWLRKKSGIS
ncbi:MAG: HEPN domain-containing protein [Proteobacteria bacterium]|nr:HEPN domain-containing protein [Desulfobulbaceae bacterium]MBU4153652.1 HEPN domain-containing protein [Pseudomonadota bacterium]